MEISLWHVVKALSVIDQLGVSIFSVMVASSQAWVKVT